MHKINRFEIINHSSRDPIIKIPVVYGRTDINYIFKSFDVEVALQDDNKTLKIFLSDKVGK